MQAAVIPELDEGHDFRHVAIDGWPADEEPVAWLLYTLHAQLKLVRRRTTSLGLYESVEWIVRQAFRRSDRPILIYLDQIEQLLLPHRDVASVEAFLDWLDRFAERPIRGLHLVLAMREDYLGRFRDRARGRHRLLENGFRLGPLTVGEIVGAVCRAAADGAPPQTWAAGGDAHADDAGAHPRSERDRRGRGPDRVRPDRLPRPVRRARGAGRGGPRRPARARRADPVRYLENTLESLGPLRGPAERLLEDHLIAADGTRTLLTEEAARASGLALAASELGRILGNLERAAILRAEQHRGTRYFELGHDWLAKKVHDRKQERLARLADLAASASARPSRRRQERAAGRQAETRRARGSWRSSPPSRCSRCGLGIFAWTQQQLARAAEGEGAGGRGRGAGGSAASGGRAGAGRTGARAGACGRAGGAGGSAGGGGREGARRAREGQGGGREGAGGGGRAGGAAPAEDRRASGA
jgi:hypothetical protein